MKNITHARIEAALQSGEPVTAGDLIVTYTDINNNGFLDSGDIFSVKRAYNDASITLTFLPSKGEMVSTTF